MAKAKAQVGSPTATAQPAVTAAPAPVSKFAKMKAAAAAMKAGGAVAEETKKSKSSVSEIPISDADVKLAKEEYILEDARKKAADSRQKVPGDTLRTWGEQERLKLCHSGQSLHKTVSLDGEISLGHGRITLAKPKEGKTEETIADGLMELFGADADKYFEPTMEIKVAPEYANDSTIELLKNKLGLDLFNRVFPQFKLKIDLKRENADDAESTVLLSRDYSLHTAVEAKVKDAIGKGLLSKSDPSLRVAESALAAAKEKLLQDEMALAQNRQMATAAAAGAAAAVAAQKSA